jgi:Zn-dependent peptidase ImmA (M78 family)/transcriptional regulator with XRE-family HTH domain
MPRTPVAIIEPSLLKWARATAGLMVEEAAKKLSVAPERLMAWEEGDEEISIAQLRAAARVYKRPLAVFYLPEPPRDFQPLRDFRRIPGVEPKQLSPELQAAIRRAHSQREIALELRGLAQEPVRNAPGIEAAPTNPEAFGEAARKLLGVGLATQLDWTDPGRALVGWTAALEQQDIMVLQAQRIDTKEMRGFSVSAAMLPVVVLNGSDSPRGRIFTLLHEYAHLLLHETGVCDLHERRGPGAIDDLEVFCNRVAAAILLPEDVFRADPRVEASPPSGRWPDATLRALSERYGVSSEVVVRRLYSLGLTTWEFLREKTVEYQHAFEDTRRATQTKEGGPGWHRMRVRDLGRPYVRLALDAYYRDDINASELSEYLEVKLNKLSKLEEELALAEARS